MAMISYQASKPLLLIVDGNALLCRSFFGTPLLNAPDGRPSNGVFGFIRTLLHVLDNYNPTHLVITFDHRSRKRNALFPDYKANRKGSIPDALFPQFEMCHRLVDDMALKKIHLEGFEADDIIAAVAKQSKSEALSTYILTSDKDLYQLIDKDGIIKMLRPTKDGLAIIGYDDVEPKFGCRPEYVPHVLALMGDSSDNIPGCPGIGEKTACKLINEYGSIENLYETGVCTTAKLRQKLDENKDIIQNSYQLTIPDLPEITINLEDFRFTSFGAQTRIAFQELGFVSLMGRI